jgi:hypothetical protein
MRAFALKGEDVGSNNAMALFMFAIAFFCVQSKGMLTACTLCVCVYV